jgi:nucleotide-binding universal stress UspA family protein
MDMYKVIVVGTDGSARAGIAVGEALALAKMSGANLHAVNVVHPAVSSGFADSREAQVQVTGMREEAERIRKQLLAHAEAEGVSIEIHNPGSGDVADALLGVAEAVSADLLVVGNRGMSGMKRFVLGSVPNKVSHQAPCSVLIVNTDET